MPISDKEQAVLKKIMTILESKDTPVELRELVKVIHASFTDGCSPEIVRWALGYLQGKGKIDNTTSGEWYALT